MFWGYTYYKMDFDYFNMEADKVIVRLLMFVMFAVELRLYRFILILGV